MMITKDNKAGIYMWEVIRRSGTICYVPLNSDLNSIPDIALQDIQGQSSNGSPEWGNFLLTSGVPEKPRENGTKRKSFDELIAKAIEAILRKGDATTYQVYEALIGRLISSNLTKVMGSVAIDVERILLDKFWCYEFPQGGAMARKWTLDEERAKSYFLSVNRQRELCPIEC